ncbi:hypothetical protein [Metallibacterium scheffleri]|uniref:SMODS and SLOG-associating 2TM effector domain-containing protein n=2 Tax=root TaxID=1 RepID=A0A4S3KSM5_9GAMM|nr:hypothetical protein [Metallibacterium scheffleri]THD12132.1 hypothetical protein B1806_00845 [Metallibacterium scheffleri]
MIPLVVGVTSHRNIPAGEIESIRRRVREFLAQLQHDFPALPLVVLSALAEGGDQLVAQEALALGARLIAPLPLPRDLYLEDFADPTTRARFEALCAHAEVLQLPLRAGQTRHAVGPPGTARDRQYAQAGVYIVNHCHILLAIWDGKESTRLGGTAQVVRYHLGGSMPGLIDRRHDARHVLGGGDERLLFHIVCSRNEADGAVAVGLQPLQALWRTAETAQAAELGMPPEFRQMFTHMAEFNDECDKYAAAIRLAVQSHRDANATLPMDDVFYAADWLAIHFQRRVLLAMRTTYTLAALMGIAFALYAHLAEHNYLIYLFLLLFASGALVVGLARHRDWHRKYLDYRALAEFLRVQSYWRHAGIPATGGHEFAHDNFLQRQNTELGWIRNVMRAVGLDARVDPATHGPEALTRVIAEWVGVSGKSGQLHYYERKTVERSGLHHITEMVGSISLWGGVAISIVLVVFAHIFAQDTKNTLVMFMATLSIIAAVREAYAYRKADKELIRQYRFMQRIFTSARTALDRATEAIEQRQILISLGEAALTEHAEWTLMQREREVEQSKL